MEIEDVPTKGNESPQHKRAKLRAYNILKENGFYPEFEIATGRTAIEVGERYFQVDVYVYWPKIRRRIALEVDGKGHSSKWSRHKMDMRDRAHEQKGILTVRIVLSRLVGKTKWSDDDIMSFIEEEIQRQQI